MAPPIRAGDRAAYEDVASKFGEHFLHIARAINHLGSDGVGMKIRSMVGLIPVFAVETLDSLPGFKRRLGWFIENRRDLTANVACMDTMDGAGRKP